MKRPRKIDEAYSPRFLDLLEAMTCEHGERRGARYCPMCRRWVAKHLGRVTR